MDENRNSILIEFDNKTRTFYPGQLIKGKVTLQILEETKVKGLVLTFFGDAEVYWTESEVRYHNDGSNSRYPRRRAVHREYRNQETFLCEQLVLFGKDDDEEGVFINLSPGIREYLFTFQLPSTALPSSFSESPYGFIKYTIEAKLARRLFQYAKINEEFFVRGIVDLNFIPAVSQPFGTNKRIDFGWSCCPEGYMTGDLTLEKTGYLPGEPIRFTVSIFNVSNILITNIQATFCQNIDFITFDRRKTTSREIKTLHYTSRVLSSYLTEWNDGFLIPQNLHPTTMAGSQIIRINYRLDVLIKLSGSKMTLSAPVFIGTEPCPRACSVETSSVEEVNPVNNNSTPTPAPKLKHESYQSRPRLDQTAKEYNPALNPFLDDFEEESESLKTENSQKNDETQEVDSTNNNKSEDDLNLIII